MVEIFWFLTNLLFSYKQLRKIILGQKYRPSLFRGAPKLTKFHKYTKKFNSTSFVLEKYFRNTFLRPLSVGIYLCPHLKISKSQILTPSLGPWDGDSLSTLGGEVFKINNLNFFWVANITFHPTKIIRCQQFFPKNSADRGRRRGGVPQRKPRPSKFFS